MFHSPYKLVYIGYGFLGFFQHLLNMSDTLLYLTGTHITVSCRIGGKVFPSEAVDFNLKTLQKQIIFRRIFI